MVALVERLRCSPLSVPLIGLVSGLLALIPFVGWPLGFAFILLASRVARRDNHLFVDLMLILLFWLALRFVAVYFFGYAAAAD